MRHQPDRKGLKMTSENCLGNKELSEHELLKLDNQLCFTLYAASRIITARYRPLLLELGLTYPQYITMLVLWESSNLSVSEIGERLILDSGTLTPLLKKLESSGLIERRRDSADERRVIVSLTAKGTELKHQAASIPEKLICGTGLSLHQITELRKKINELIAGIGSSPAS